MKGKGTGCCCCYEPLWGWTAEGSREISHSLRRQSSLINKWTSLKVNDWRAIQVMTVTTTPTSLAWLESTRERWTLNSQEYI